MTDETKQANEIGAPPDAATAFAVKAKDLEALRAAVVDAASVGAGLWLSYLFVLFYLTIAVGGITHRDLLFENPVKLPFLNVDLPLKGFFFLGPLLFLIVHAYVLLHFVLLAGKIGAFHAELQAQITDEDARAGLRRQLPSNIFVQILAGPREVRTGIIGGMLRIVAQISLVGAPLALLAFFQLQFLPYHGEVIIWWQRLTVVADLVLLWILWPPVARGETTSLAWRDLRRGKVAAWALASLAPVLLVFTIATFPGEWLDQNLPSIRIVPTKWPFTGWTSPHDLLVGGDVDFVAQKPTSLWSNRLVLPNIDVIDHAKFDTEAKIAALPETLSLRGRRLEGAVLLSARLRKADFTGAHLRGADLSRADLREATFGCGTTSQCADLRGARLFVAQLQGASLEGAQLQGAELGGAQLQGALLTGARLQGALLVGAQLQGAYLRWAHMQGAWLGVAQLQGASLDQAELQGASLDDARLQGAWLYDTQLQGAKLDDAQLRGATLDYAQLQGASLDGAQLQGASLSHVFAWRADARKMNAEGALVVAPETRPKYVWPDCPAPRQSACDWSAGSFAALKGLIEREVPEGSRRDAALKRIAILDPAQSLNGWEEVWADLARSSPSLDVYEASLVARLRETGCDASGAPYVIRELLLIRRSRFVPRPQPPELAAAFLDEAQCPGARGLSEDEKLHLRDIRDRRLSEKDKLKLPEIRDHRPPVPVTPKE
jgi:uncharacterized protein YjbI with pentapeptide repeats